MNTLLMLTLLGASVDSIGLTVSDLDRSVEFYTKVLPFEKVSEFEAHGEAWERATGVFGARVRTARLKLGTEAIELTEFLAPQGAAAPPDSRSNDRWFQHVAIVVSDMDAAYTHLRKHKVRHASTGPQTLPAWNPNAGGIQAFYFRDPDGHPLEVIWFPAGKGDPRWQKRDGRLFLGIDHTAIVVEDSDRSIAFYRDRLGMRVAGHSENYGPEQERLNNVFGARLRITGLRGDGGPGVELLEYLAPRDGRAYPASAKPNDLLHWQTRFAGEAGDRAVTIPDAAAGYSKSVLIRDPDGHAVQIVEK